MKLTYIAHACFKLEIDGLSIIFDPYKTGAFDGAVGYKPIEDKADVVFTSHSHEDHNAVFEVKGSPRLINQPGKYEINGIEIEGIRSFHDPAQGRERGITSSLLSGQGISALPTSGIRDLLMRGC